MKESTLTYIKSVLLFIYLIIAIGVEQAYKQPLFDYSLTFIKDLQSSISKSFMTFIKIISYTGSFEVLIPCFLIIFLCFPLNKSYMFISILILSTYFDNILKSFYENPRPFWINSSLQMICAAGYGNPSNHSFTSSAIYLSLWHMLTSFDWFKQGFYKTILRYILLAIFLLLICVIMVSRLFVGVHSIDQIIYGSSLGLGLYYFYFFILELHLINGASFKKHLMSYRNMIVYSIIYCLLFTLSLAIYLMKKDLVNPYRDIILDLCPSMKPYRILINDGFYQSLTLFLMIGFHYGLMIVFYWSSCYYENKEEEIVNWQKITTNKGIINAIYRILLLIPFTLVMILFFVIPSTALFPIIFIFKISIPLLVTGLLITGGYLITSIKIKIVNEQIDVEEKKNSYLPLALDDQDNNEIPSSAII